MNTKSINRLFYLFFSLIVVSCVKSTDLYEGTPNGGVTDNTPPYIYPFGDESQNTTAEIIIKTDGTVDLNAITAEIPYLKYNKSWLFMLTQDDCKQAAYSCTWAVINGKPFSNTYYYNASQLKVGDLPPDVYTLNKTLGSKDGTGNEVRFSITTTLASEDTLMSDKTNVNLGYKDDYYRFKMKSFLVWENVIEMLNYGDGIAFHDVATPDVYNSDLIKLHYAKSQAIILDKLSGRGCKMLAEPNGNKSYVTAALSYDPIQVMTAQTGTVKLYPFQVKEDDLHKKLLNRTVYQQDEPFYYIKSDIKTQLALNKEAREAINIGVHGTDENWVRFLLWLDETYGKDGDDSVWFPSMEEYYEYNYYRIHGSVVPTVVDNSTLKLTVSLPSGQYFYYPSTTINLKGLAKEHVKSVTSGTSVTGLSYGNYGDGIMLNLDCRKYLVEHATHFVEQYESNKTKSNKNDAIYFVNMLKESDTKAALLKRIN